MLILLPVFLLLITAAVLLIFFYSRPRFRSIWLIAAGGPLLGLASIFLWQTQPPQTFALLAWQPQNIFGSSPTWVADDISWVFSVCITTLALAIIITSVVRTRVNPIAWAGIHFLALLGILAVSADNPLTLVMVWTAIDLAELISMLRTVEGERRAEGIVIAFAARLAGTGLVLWASVLSSADGVTKNFLEIPARAGIYLLLAAGVRLGVLPLHLPYRQEHGLRRGFGSMLRLVSAASSLALLARIPNGALPKSLLPFLLILTALSALYAGWMWLWASDEMDGRPFWLLGMSSLATAAAIQGNPTGSAGWSSALILSGGLLFLYSARQKYTFVLIMIGIWGMTTLPFSPTGAGWQSETHFLFLIPYLISQALLITGFIRHSNHAGESSLDSYPRMTGVVYFLGLILILSVQISLGLLGWNGARKIGPWWAGLAALALTPVLLWIRMRKLPGEVWLPTKTARWAEIFRLSWFFRGVWSIYRFLGKTSTLVTATLEGDGGVIWSFLLLVLFLSILTQVIP